MKINYKQKIEKILLEQKKKNLISINKKDLDKKFQSFNETGIYKKKRSPEIIVSLTSFPPRMYDIHYALFSLLTQTLKPDKIILWLGEEKFPNKLNDLPDTVLRLQNLGLTIKFVPDLRSYTKLIYSLKEFPDDIIVTADDDIFYPSDWLEKLYNGYLADNGQNIIVHRAHKIKIKDDILISYNKWDMEIDDNTASFSNFLTGVGGVLYPPHSLHQDVNNKDLFQRLSPTADDIWFWAMALLNNKKIKVIKNPINKLCNVNVDRQLGINNEETLSNLNVSNRLNDTQLKNILNEYPQILKMLKEAINV